MLRPVAPPDVQPVHIDRVLTRIVQSGAPTVANDAPRYMSRMVRMAVRNWPDTLNVALKRLQVLRIEHFTVHDMRRTA